MSAIQRLDRRSFLKTGAAAAGGLVLGFYLPENNSLVAQTAPGVAGSAEPGSATPGSGSGCHRSLYNIIDKLNGIDILYSTLAPVPSSPLG